MKRIIVAERQPFLARMLRRALANAGYQVQTIGDGAQALLAIDRQPPDALVTAVSLPGLDGVELCRRVRRSRQPDLPIIAMSGLADPRVAVELAGIGRLVLLTKPVSLRMLLAELQEFFDADATADTLVGAEGAP